MKTPLLVGLSFLMTTAVGLLCAQESAMEQVTRAGALNDQGKFRTAIELIEPVLFSNAHGSNDALIGVAWNIRGLAFQALGDLDKARRSYEAAIGILRGVPAQETQLASALDNLGSLNAELGQLEESKSLRIRAKQLFESLSDHSGVARILSNLALVAIAQGNRKEARHNLAGAFYEESFVPVPDVGDLAAMYSTQCLEDEREGDFRAGLAAINRAIQLWTEHYGSDYYLLAAGYSLRGRAYGGLRDYQNALHDLQHSLLLLKENSEEGSRVYLLTELSYAQVLRDSGMKREASQTESEARSALEGLRHRRCDARTISAESLR
jgi:tetratricopeptide (TPR) repeat protein